MVSGLDLCVLELKSKRFYQPKLYVPQGLRQRISLIRDKSTQRAEPTRYNPLVITVREMWKNPWPAVNHAELNELVLVLGADVSGRDTLGLFRIQFVDQPTS
ncbi:hypothetical protein AMECASPLE_036862 [Ameca splendens]|uniref:Uncharacterized protein n=1 Tax=Ameca splendens TaxID=208324 RepID=A0ABV1AE68_9TELE